jgi:ribosomal protein S18 acetylase RimI-like enzyme
MSAADYSVRNAHANEFEAIGKLMVHAYSTLEGFLKVEDHPHYYNTLANIGELLRKPETELIVAVSPDGEIDGAVVFFGDMTQYGSGGIATQEKQSAGFRFLAVSDSARGKGLGKLLTLECIDRAKQKHLKQVIIHTTMAMLNAWKMYEKIGFKRSEDLDFIQGDLKVFGFRFRL